MSALTIERITATEVVVPSNPGSVNGAGLDKPLHKLPSGGKKAWSRQFDDFPKVILRMDLSDGTQGLGELYRDHDWEVVEALSDYLIGTDIRSLTLQDLPFAKCREYDGFEVAVWDSYAKAHGMRVVDLLGGAVREDVEIGAWTGQRHAYEVAQIAADFQAQGYTTLKFKCDLNDDVVGWCQSVAEAAPGMKVILDPNERFQRPYEARRILAGLTDVGNVLCLEDPIPHWMFDEYNELRAFSPIAIARHIALPYAVLGNRLQVVFTAIKHGLDGFNFTCGLADFQRLDHVAYASGRPSWHGSEVDLGIMEAAYVHSAAAAMSCTWPSDIFGTMIRSNDLLKTPLNITPPTVRVPSGLGLGVELDEDCVAEFRVDEREYTR